MERCEGTQRGGLAGTELLMCGCRRKEKSFARTVGFLVDSFISDIKSSQLFLAMGAACLLIYLT